MILRIALYSVVALLAGAHFLRAGEIGLVAFCLATPLLFLWRTRWSLIALQLLAYAAAANWIVVAFRIAEVRQLTGRSWTTAALILAAVGALTLLAGLLLNARSVRARYAK